MQIQQRNFRLAAIAISTIVGANAFADDINPPTWRLSNPSATVQEWDFNSPALPLAPDGNSWGSGGGGFVNPFGVPTLDASTTAIWMPMAAGRPGIYMLPGGQPSMTFTIPNHFHANENKKMWIQITWFAGGAPFKPDVDIASSAFSGPATLVSTVTLADGWSHTSYAVNMQGCPDVERIRIGNLSPVAIAIDQVVVDTICTPVPEPATMAALGLGSAALIRNRRRRA